MFTFHFGRSPRYASRVPSAPVATDSPPRTDRLVARAMLALWIVSLPLMVVGLGGPDVSRTQEARVLETAREMLGSGWRGWIIPHLNGRVRLEKPPLAYWMAAASYQ